jgi:hypothetical protein
LGELVISSNVWFTVKEKKWKVGFFGKFSWTGKEELWDSDNCTINIARTVKDKCLIVVRSNQLKYSSFMGKKFCLGICWALGFQENPLSLQKNSILLDNIPERREGPKERWVIQLDGKHWIWQWAQEGEEITNSVVHGLYWDIVNELEHSSITGDNVIKTQID